MVRKIGRARDEEEDGGRVSVLGFLAARGRGREGVEDEVGGLVTW